MSIINPLTLTIALSTAEPPFASPADPPALDAPQPRGGSVEILDVQRLLAFVPPTEDPGGTAGK